MNTFLAILFTLPNISILTCHMYAFIFTNRQMAVSVQNKADTDNFVILELKVDPAF